MEIDGKTAIYGLIGHPVSHSLSPSIQNAAFKAYNMNAVYVTFDVRNLSQAVEGIKGLGIQGVNVTLPWKKAILSYLDEVSEIAGQSGAVNTIVRKADRLIATNTDVTGLLRLFRKKGFAWKGKRVVVLGAGGAARAVVTALKVSGAIPVVFNREKDKELAMALSRDLSCPFFPLETITLPEDAIAVINCTTVGMTPNVDRSPIPKGLLRRRLIVMDAVYAPARTQLLKEAEEIGCQVVYGTEWLLAQGADSFSFWTGKKAPEAAMENALLTWMKSHET